MCDTLLTLSLDIRSSLDNESSWTNMDYIVNYYSRRRAIKKKLFIKNTIFLDITKCSRRSYKYDTTPIYIFNFRIPIFQGADGGIEYAYKHISYLLQFWDEAEFEDSDFPKIEECRRQLKKEYTNRRHLKSNNIKLQFIKNN